MLETDHQTCHLAVSFPLFSAFSFPQLNPYLHRSSYPQRFATTTITSAPQDPKSADKNGARIFCGASRCPSCVGDEGRLVLLSLGTPHRQCPRVLSVAMRRDLAAPTCPPLKSTPLLGAHAARHHLLFGAYHAGKRKRISPKGSQLASKGGTLLWRNASMPDVRKDVSHRLLGDPNPLRTGPYLYLPTPLRSCCTTLPYFFSIPTYQLLPKIPSSPILTSLLRLRFL